MNSADSIYSKHSAGELFTAAKAKSGPSGGGGGGGDVLALACGVDSAHWTRARRAKLILLIVRRAHCPERTRRARGRLLNAQPAATCGRRRRASSVPLAASPSPHKLGPSRGATCWTCQDGKRRVAHDPPNAPLEGTIRCSPRPPALEPSAARANLLSTSSSVT